MDQKVAKSGAWSTDNRIVSSTLPSFVTETVRFKSSPGEILTNPLSPADVASIDGRYFGRTDNWISIWLLTLASGSVTVIVKVPELLGNALVESLNAIVVVADIVGITLLTFESVGITSQTLSKPETAIVYDSIADPLLSIVSVIFVASPGDKIT